MLFSITGGPDLSLFEVEEAAGIIKETADPEANIIFGTVIDERMGDEVSITVIATGFDASRKIHRAGRRRATADADARVSRDYLRDLQDERAAAVPVMAEASSNGAANAAAGAGRRRGPGAPRCPPRRGCRPPAIAQRQPPGGRSQPAAPRGVPEVEDLDIPAFLRRNRDH